MPKFKSPSQSSEDKRNRVEESLTMVNTKAREVFTSEKIMEYLGVASQFPNYSLNNQMLILLQNPSSTETKGFNEWKKEGRYVRKGEKAIQILAPTTYNRKVREYVLNEKGERVKDEAGNDITREVSKPTKGYTLVNVFDISQTEGKEPNFDIIETLKNAELKNQLFLESLMAISKIPIHSAEEDVDFPSKLTENGILVNPNLSNNQVAKPIMDDYVTHIVNSKDLNLSQEEQELIINMASYMVANHFNINTSEYSFGGIDEYVSGLNVTNPNGIPLPEYTRIKELLKQSSSISKEIIEEMEPVFKKEYILGRAKDAAEDIAWYIEGYGLLDSQMDHDKLTSLIQYHLLKEDTEPLVNWLQEKSKYVDSAFAEEQAPPISKIPFVLQLVSENGELIENVEKPTFEEEIPVEEPTTPLEESIEEPIPNEPIENVQEEKPPIEPIESPKSEPLKQEKSKKESGIEDFGDKIGGAKKDLWRSRGLLLDDLEDMNSAERSSYIKKDNVWIKPDYQAMVDGGMDVRLVYFIKTIRDALPTKPLDSSEEGQKNYINFVNALKNEVMGYMGIQDAKGLYKNFIEGQGYVVKTSSYYVEVTPEGKAAMNNKLLKACQVNDSVIRKLEREIAKKQFCYSEEQKIMSGFSIIKYSSETHKFEMDRDRVMLGVKVPGGTAYIYPKDEEYSSPDKFKEGTYYIIDSRRNFIGKDFESYEAAKKHILDTHKPKEVEKPSVERKKKLVPKQLEHIDRIGPAVRDRDIEGDDFLRDFGIRGGEFGNWLNDNDRQASMNFAYEAFRDLALALNIPDTDIGLNGNLAIAFGARGSGNALAHYEPLREVINLTKMKGAGSLGHEFFHALDDRAGKDIAKPTFLTSQYMVPDAVKKLVSAMKYKEVEKQVAVNSEVIESYNKDIKKREEYFYSYIKYYLPDKALTPEQIEKRDELIAKAFASRVECGSLKGLNIQYHSPEVEAISQFRKEVLGHIIPAKDRNGMAHNLSSRLHFIEWKEQELAKEGSTEVEKKREETDFYKNSQKVDANYSKNGHDYWQSTIEMAARAFACYVQDKLSEMGIRNDYLVGHAELAIAPISKKDGGIEIVKAYPEGEERKAINRAFDEMFVEFKKLGILHEREVPQAIEKKVAQSKEEEHKKENKKSKGPRL